MAIKLSDSEFIAVWEKCNGSPAAVRDATGMTERAVYGRRKTLADKGITLTTVSAASSGAQPTGWQDVGRAYKRQNEHSLQDGTVLVFSDAHWWPNQPKTASHIALLKLCKELRPRIVVANGDLFDGARVSRHPPMGWVEPPTVKEELDIGEEYLHEIHLAADPKRCAFYWNMGNHDQRFDRTLAMQASDFGGAVDRLEDRFSDWDFAWSLCINGNVMIKHRYHNGVHAGYNNTLKAGWSVVTGHLHRLLVTPWADYNGRRWGVDTGTLSDPLAPQFEYGENNPTPHTSGFAVLTFKDGMLLPPELVEVINGDAYFRGERL